MRYKFRAWLKQENKMVEPYAINFESKVIFYKEPYEDDENMEQIKTASFDEIELMQYTGLIDNNYDEIYEGDIVEILTEVEEYGIVKFFEGAFYVEADGFRVNFYDNIGSGDVLVIDNIYEHKELLEDE